MIYDLGDLQTLNWYCMILHHAIATTGSIQLSYMYGTCERVQPSTKSIIIGLCISASGVQILSWFYEVRDIHIKYTHLKGYGLGLE